MMSNYIEHRLLCWNFCPTTRKMNVSSLFDHKHCHIQLRNMLPGSMYPKKTYGKSLFIGEFKHSAAVAESEAIATAHTKVEEPKPEKIDNETPPDINREQVNVSRTLTYEIHQEEEKKKREEIKLVWKNSSVPATSAAKPIKGPASKAFFTPASKEDRNNDAEQVLDLPVTKDESVIDIDTTKAVKKKKASAAPANQGRKTLIPKPLHLNVIPKPKVASKQSSPRTPPAESKKVDLEETRKYSKAQEKDVPEVPREVQVETQEDEEDPAPGKETSESIPRDFTSVDEEVNQEVNHTEFVAQNKKSRDPKSIIIKPLDLAGYAEKLIEDEELEPTNVLQPEVVADIKRDLAEKGIIVLPPNPNLAEKRTGSEEQLDVKAEEVAVAETPTSSSSNTDQQLSEGKDTEAIEDGSAVDPAAEQSSELTVAEKSDRETYKTNKSFEIRRLQAKAEREKEEKRKALFGSRYTQLKARSDYMSRAHHHAAKHDSKNDLKPAIAESENERSRGILKSQSPLPIKSKTSVRIRDPECDYQEYTDIELDSDSGDSIRPNSSLSELTVFSGISSDSSSLGTSAGDDAYLDLPYSDEEGYSPQDGDIHQLYDEIDNLNPSRIGFYSDGPRKENISRDSRRERIESGTSRVTARSSLHLPTDQSHPQSQQSSNMRVYNDRPMPLFDALRHDWRIDSSEGRHHKSRDTHRVRVDDVKRSRGQQRKEVVFTIENERNSPPRGWSRESLRHHNKQQRHRSRGRHNSPEEYSKRAQTNLKNEFRGNMPVAFGPAIYPILNTSTTSAGYTQRDWKERVEKFFETSYANEEPSGRQQNNQTISEDVLDKSDEVFMKKRLTGRLCTGRRCRRCHAVLDCSKMSTISHLLCVAIPTIVCTVAILVMLFYVTGILPVEPGGAIIASNSTTDDSST